jgi:methylated-DNA-[protein]-cysteine S-methyltransferase
MFYSYMDSPVGKLFLAGDQEGIRFINFPKEKKPVVPDSDWVEMPAFFTSAVAELEEYFAGSRRHFSVDIQPRGTDFQLSVWRALQKVPYGKTVSYGELAKRVGNPNASRAVGAANGANPIPIIIPCHRVIGAGGNLTGFGGGLAVKQFLLELEGAIA